MSEPAQVDPPLPRLLKKASAIGIVVLIGISHFVGKEVGAWILLFVVLTVLALFSGLLPRSVAARVAYFIQAVVVQAPHARRNKDPSSAKFNFHRITKNLVLGRQPRSSADVQTVHDLGCRAVVCFNEDWELFVSPEDPIWDELGWERLDIPCPDFSAPTDEEIHTMYTFIERHKDVYIHCNAGRGRSSVGVAAYLLEHPNDEFSEAASSPESPMKLLKALSLIRPQISKSLARYPTSAQARAVWRAWGRAQSADKKKKYM